MQKTSADPAGRWPRYVQLCAAKAPVIASILVAGAVLGELVFGGPVEWLTTAVLSAVILALAYVAFRTRRQIEESRAVTAILGARLEETQDRIWELSENLIRQRDLVDAQGDAIYRHDMEGRLTFANDAFRHMFGIAPDVALGTQPIPVALDPIEKPRPTGAPRLTFDARYETADGIRWLQWQDTPIRDARGEVVEVQCVGRDVTMHREAEEALRRARDAAEDASQAKSRFLAAVSHEIRTPMNGIIGMADLLLDSGLTQEQTTYAHAVHNSATALLGMIDEILDFSRIEAGRLELANDPFSLATVVSDVAELLAPRAAEKKLEIAAFVARTVPPVVRGDADRLRQVLVNLAANGIKFTDRGGVSIAVRPDPGGILITVSDTGIGIPEKARERIFEEFEQADAGLARQHGGAGLGLAICRRIVAAMGGTIAVSPRNGTGSVFSVHLPLGPATKAPDSPLSLASRHVLVASPSPILRDVLQAMLQDEGARVDTVARADTLKRRLAAHRAGTGPAYDSLLVDLPLADSVDPATIPPIVLLSPHDRGALPDFTRRGFGGYLIKPVRSQSLLARLGAAGARNGRAATAPAQEEPAGPALNVLLAEDNDLNAMLTEALLRRLGHRVTRVRDGAQAVKKIRSARERGRPFDVALMDVHMPHLDGLSAAREVRALEEKAPRGGRIAMIALTANAFSESRDACLAAGMDMFLTKPVDREALATCLNRVTPARSTPVAAKAHHL